MAAKSVPGQISSLYQYIAPSLKHGVGDVDANSRANAHFQAELILKSSPLLAGMAKDGKLAVRSAFYDIGTGQVEF